jgi:hypothetical protein
MLTIALDELSPQQTLVPVIESAITEREQQQDALQAPIPAACGEALAQEVPEDPPKALVSVEAPSFELWLAAGRALAKSARSVNFEIGDHINFGKRIFGSEAIIAVQRATGWTRNFVSRVASICERFPADKRLPEVSFDIYKVLPAFPPEITDKLLPMAAAEKIGARRIYRMACELAGEDPADRARYLRKNVSIPSALYEKLRERTTGGTVSKLAQEIIEEWLVGAPVERKASGPRTQEWKERVLAS